MFSQVRDTLDKAQGGLGIGLSLVKKRVEMHGGSVTAESHTGPDALAAARAFAPNVAFLDIGLPGMDGYEVARRLRADPVTADIVLAALTGWGREDDKRRSRDVGFDFHLTKPVDQDAINQVLAQFSALDRRPGS